MQGSWADLLYAVNLKKLLCISVEQQNNVTILKTRSLAGVNWPCFPTSLATLIYTPEDMVQTVQLIAMGVREKTTGRLALETHFPLPSAVAVKQDQPE